MPRSDRYSVSPVAVESMLTRDGVRLDADVYRPETDASLPVLVMRQPYGRRIASTVTYAHPSWYAAHGYVVVVQDVRGRGTSKGEFDLFAHERDDGVDTVAWAAQLMGANGRVGMYGFSYQGMTQLFAAAGAAPELEAICPAMAGFDTRADMAWENGTFCALRNIGWAAQLGAETARRAGDDVRFRRLYALGHAPALEHLIDPRNPVLREALAGTHYDAWLDEPPAAAYWSARSPSSQLQTLNVPALFIGGWFDGFLAGTLRAYRELSGAAPRRLVVGPWGHLPWSRHIGESDMGAAARSDSIDHAQLAWFDRYLKDDVAVDIGAPVTLFDMGAKQWRDFPAWPEPSIRSLYLQTDVATCGGGALAETPGDAESRLVHDPWRPVSDLGHHAGRSAGPQVRNTVDEQPDVIYYESEPMASETLVAGDVTLRLMAEADQPSFDISAVVSIVDRTGIARNLCRGIQRVAADDVDTPRQVSLRAICATIAPGERLRLSLSGACFPACDVNSGQGGVEGAAALSVITLCFKDHRESRLELPLAAN